MAAKIATGRNIPSLDGLRAISIAFVVAGHLTGTRDFPAILNPMRALAGPGVRIFFVISGFLITTLLLQELDRTGRISLGGFYRRRAFRIFPAFYLYLGVIAALGLARSADLLRAATYTINYVDARDWTVAHIWSLAVEEQFYLLWPLTLAFLGRQRGLTAAGLVVFLSPIVRIVQYQFFPDHQAGIGAEFHTVADALACGCLLAGFRGDLWTFQPYRRLLESKWFAVVPMVLFLELAIQSGRPLYYSAVGMSLLNIGLTVCVDRAMRLSNTWSGRVLNSPTLVFFGILSYSIYLWQQVFLNRAAAAPWAAFPLNIILAFGVALLSYYLVEKPLITFGRSLQATSEKRAGTSEGASGKDDLQRLPTRSV